MLTLIQEGGFNPPIHLHSKKYQKERQLVCHIRILCRWLAAQDYSVSNASVYGAPTLTVTLVKIERKENLLQTCDPPWL